MSKRVLRKKDIEQIFSVILVAALLVACISGLSALFNKKTTTISPTVFSVGGVDEDGVHENVKTSIYTKDLIECQGLTIEPDYEADGKYQVYYYNAMKEYLGTSGELRAESGIYKKGETFSGAKYCRIVITPDVPEDFDGDEFKIRFYEVLGYAKDYNITVDKKQKSVDYYINMNNLVSCGWSIGTSGDLNGIRVDSPKYFGTLIELSTLKESYNSVTIVNEYGESCMIGFLDEIPAPGAEVEFSQGTSYITGLGIGVHDYKIPSSSRYLFVYWASNYGVEGSEKIFLPESIIFSKV